MAYALHNTTKQINTTNKIHRPLIAKNSEKQLFNKLFKILDFARTPFRLKAEEAFYINQLKPNLTFQNFFQFLIYLVILIRF